RRATSFISDLHANRQSFTRSILRAVEWGCSSDGADIGVPGCCGSDESEVHRTKCDTKSVRFCEFLRNIQRFQLFGSAQTQACVADRAVMQPLHGLPCP